jgi:hypothetical protein
MTVYGGDTIGGPTGFTYTAIFLAGSREQILDALVAVRYSGWVGPQEEGWVVAVPGRPHGAVAGAKMTAAGVAQHVSRTTGAGAVAATVDDDKLLTLWAYNAGEDAGEYVSDPQVARPGDDEAGFEPEGSENASFIAAACGVPESTEALEEILAEELGESTNESERLTAIVRLLGLPDWIVAASSLPKDVPGGPRAKEFTRLGAGKEGVAGAVSGAVKGIVRKKA